VRQLNFINNYYKGGPSSQLWQLVSIDGDEIGTGDMQKGYVSGNKMVNASGNVILNSNEDNWRICMSKFSTVSNVRSNSPLFPISIEPISADEAYDTVITDVGATKPAIDAIDQRILKEVKEASYTYTGSRDGYRGILDSQNDAGGYPEYSGGNPPADSDQDGMPDDWESEHGLNPNDASDRNNTNLSVDDYTNLEMYLNELAGDPVQFASTAVRLRPVHDASKRIAVSTKGVTLNYPEGTRIRVEWLNISGRLVERVYDGAMMNDSRFFPFCRLRGKTAGVYLLRVTGEVENAILSIIMTQ
jgi:hypothetical protein